MSALPRACSFSLLTGAARYGGQPATAERAASHGACEHCGHLEHVEEQGSARCTFCGACTPIIDDGEEFRTFEGKEDRNHHGSAHADGLLAGRELSTTIGTDTNRHNRLQRLHRQVQAAGQYREDKKLAAFLLMEQAQHQLGLAGSVVRRAKAWFAHMRDSMDRLPHHTSHVAICLVAAHWHAFASTAAAAARRRALARNTDIPGAPWLQADPGGRAVARRPDGATAPVAFPRRGVYVVQVAAGAPRRGAGARGGAWAGRQRGGPAGPGHRVDRARPAEMRHGTPRRRWVTVAAAARTRRGWTRAAARGPRAAARAPRRRRCPPPRRRWFPTRWWPRAPALSCSRLPMVPWRGPWMVMLSRRPRARPPRRPWAGAWRAGRGCTQPRERWWRSRIPAARPPRWAPSPLPRPALARRRRAARARR